MNMVYGDIHVPQRMNFNTFSDLLTFQLTQYTGLSYTLVYDQIL